MPGPVLEDGERVNIPLVVVRLAFEPGSYGGVEMCFVKPAKAQDQTDDL